MVTVTDREGDIYELFAFEREANSELLIRAKHNRRINHELKLVKQAIAQIRCSGQLVISVPRKDDQPTREANLTVRHASFTFQAPSNRPKILNSVNSERKCTVIYKNLQKSITNYHFSRYF